MTYDFALDKKAIISLIAGSVAIGVLLFVGGLIVGRQWLAADAVMASTNADDERAALPNEPVLNEEAVPRSSGAPQKGRPALVLPKQTGDTPAEQSVEPAPAAVPGKVPAPQVVSEAGSDSAAADQSALNEQQSAAESDYVTVQVGVFLNEKDASHLLQQMEGKGYRPTFFSGRDAEARQWYAVRIGVYSDKQQAANAAANFAKQEKMKAVVRPVESL